MKNITKIEIDASEKLMLPNQKETEEVISCKKLSELIKAKILRKGTSQYSLRKDYKHHVLSVEKDSTGASEYQSIVYKSCHADKISKNDPKPRCCHECKVIVTIEKINKALIELFLCDYGYYYRLNHVCRNLYSTRDEIPAIEYFHPDCLLSHPMNMHKNKEHKDIESRSMCLIRRHK